MSNFLVGLLLCCVLISGVVIEWDEDLLGSELCYKDYSGKSCLVKFFSPYCGHCKRMAPAFEEVAEDHENDASVRIGGVNCAVLRGTCSKFNIDGYPTILLIERGKAYTYSGSRSRESFNEFITSHSEAKSTSLPSLVTSSLSGSVESRTDEAGVSQPLERVTHTGSILWYSPGPALIFIIAGIVIGTFAYCCFCGKAKPEILNDSPISSSFSDLESGDESDEHLHHESTCADEDCSILHRAAKDD